MNTDDYLPVVLWLAALAMMNLVIVDRNRLRARPDWVENQFMRLMDEWLPRFALQSLLDLTGNLDAPL